MLCGLVTALSFTVNIPVRVPVAVGAKAMLTVQLAPAPSVAPQVVAVCLKSPAFVPPIVTLEIVSVVASTFLIVTFLLALVAPTFAVKVSDDGLRVTGKVPVPLSVTLCGLLVASSTIVKVAALAPDAAGAKARLMVQEDWNARLAPHVEDN